MRVNIELENYDLLYFPDFSLSNEDEELKILIEYLSILRRDLKGLIFYIEESKKGVFKSNLVEYLNEVRNALLTNIYDTFDYLNSIELSDLELLKIKVSDNYIMFSVYLDYNYTPIKVIISRKLRNMEFYFLEKREYDEPYIDDYFLTYFQILKNNVHMRGSYIKDYSFIYNNDTNYIQNIEECVLKLKKYQR